MKRSDLIIHINRLSELSPEQVQTFARIMHAKIECVYTILFELEKDKNHPLHELATLLRSSLEFDPTKQ